MASGYFASWYALTPAAVRSFHFASSSFRSSGVSFLGGSSAAALHSPAASATSTSPGRTRVMVASLHIQGRSGMPGEEARMPPSILPTGEAGEQPPREVEKPHSQWLGRAGSASCELIE